MKTRKQVAEQTYLPLGFGKKRREAKEIEKYMRIKKNYFFRRINPKVWWVTWSKWLGLD